MATIHIRLDDMVVERIDALIPIIHIKRPGELTTTRSDVVRYCLAEGIDTYEKAAELMKTFETGSSDR